MSTAHALPSELTIFTASECHPLYLAWLRAEAPESASDETLWLDASAVAEADGAGIQLLVSLANSLARQGRALKLRAAGPSLTAACIDLGAAFLLDKTPHMECTA